MSMFVGSTYYKLTEKEQPGSIVSIYFGTVKKAVKHVDNN